MKSMPDDSDSKKVIVGRINGVSGIRGEVKLFSYTRPRDQIFTYSPWYLNQDGVWLECKVIQGNAEGKGCTARIEGISDRNHAMQMMDAEIAIEASQLPVLPHGVYYWHQLPGLRVETTDGRQLGVIKAVEETGANDVLVVQGTKKLLIPFVWETIVQSIDLDRGIMQIDWDLEYI